MDDVEEGDGAFVVAFVGAMVAALVVHGGSGGVRRMMGGVGCRLCALSPSPGATPRLALACDGDGGGRGRGVPLQLQRGSISEGRWRQLPSLTAA